MVVLGTPAHPRAPHPHPRAVGFFPHPQHVFPHLCPKRPQKRLLEENPSGLGFGEGARAAAPRNGVPPPPGTAPPRDSPTWTASWASSWGWGLGSSLCSCVSAGGGDDKENPFEQRGLNPAPPQNGENPTPRPLVGGSPNPVHLPRGPKGGQDIAVPPQGCPRAPPAPPRGGHTHVGGVLLVGSPLLGREALRGQRGGSGTARLARGAPPQTCIFSKLF